MRPLPVRPTASPWSSWHYRRPPWSSPSPSASRTWPSPAPCTWCACCSGRGTWCTSWRRASRSWCRAWHRSRWRRWSGRSSRRAPRMAAPRPRGTTNSTRSSAANWGIVTRGRNPAPIRRHRGKRSVRKRCRPRACRTAAARRAAGGWATEKERGSECHRRGNSCLLAFPTQLQMEW